MDENKTFTYRDSKNQEHTVTFAQGDFELTQFDRKLTDTKMKSKPTTFFKDAFKRFAKNKSSVTGAVILGTILLLTIFVPIFDTNSLDTTDPNLSYQTKLAPRLFDAGTGFWDGTTEYKNIAIDTDWDAYDKDGTISGYPVTNSNASFSSDAIVGDISYTLHKQGMDDVAASYAHGGYIRLTSTAGDSKDGFLQTSVFAFSPNLLNYSLHVEISAIPDDFVYGDQGVYSLSFLYSTDNGANYSTLVLDENKSEAGTYDYNLSELLSASAVSNMMGRFVLTVARGNTNQNVLLKKAVFSVSDGSTMKASDTEIAKMAAVSSNDASATLRRNSNEYPFTTNSSMNVYHADYVTGSFRYDTYQAVYSDVYMSNIAVSQLEGYEKNGWMSFSYSLSDFTNGSLSEEEQAKFLAGVSLTAEGVEHCPLRIDAEHPLSVKVAKAGKVKTASFSGTISRYRLYGYTSIPRFIFGTDSQGRDMFKLVFDGLRYSVILGVVTSLINLVFGLIWGAISGYFGGWTDIVMERVCEILGGIPWVVVMTLILINKPAGTPTILMVGIALCTTGWIGTAGLTRTQFYRFKDREYILAARTLGASDRRLIFRHILPNAVGTLITSSVLMIPSVIFSEASLSYLGLVNGMQGFGTTLSDNQIYMTTYPYLIIFPSVVMALIMISFNLFGNGLRDAFNPSLKGGE